MCVYIYIYEYIYIYIYIYSVAKLAIKLIISTPLYTCFLSIVTAHSALLNLSKVNLLPDLLHTMAIKLTFLRNWIRYMLLICTLPWRISNKAARSLSLPYKSTYRADFWEIVPEFQCWTLIRASLWPLNQISQKSALSVILYCKLVLISELTFEKLYQEFNLEYWFVHYFDLYIKYLKSQLCQSDCIANFSAGWLLRNYYKVHNTDSRITLIFDIWLQQWTSHPVTAPLPLGGPPTRAQVFLKSRLNCLFTTWI